MCESVGILWWTPVNHSLSHTPVWLGLEHWPWPEILQFPKLFLCLYPPVEVKLCESKDHICSACHCICPQNVERLLAYSRKSINIFWIVKKLSTLSQASNWYKTNWERARLSRTGVSLGDGGRLAHQCPWTPHHPACLFCKPLSFACIILSWHSLPPGELVILYGPV